MQSALDFSGRATRPLDFSGRGRVLDRSMGERGRDNIGDGARRSALGATLRAADPEADGFFNLRDLTKVRPGSPIDFALDHTVGPDRRWFAADESVPTLGDVVTGQGLRGRPAAEAEDARRANYDARGTADPINNPGDAVAYFGGQVLGGVPSPENWVGGGAMRVAKPAGGVAVTGARRALDFAARAGERIALQGAIAGGTDAALQVGDIQSGIEERYSPLQTLLAVGVGGVIGGGIDIAAPGAGRALDAGRRGALDFSGRAATLARETTARTQQAFANPVPAFDGPAMDLGSVVRPSGDVPSPLGTFGQPDGSAREGGVQFAAPVVGPVSSGFGPRARPNARASSNHQGLDFAVAEGTPVAAAADGEVIFAGPRGNYGNRVEVRHADGSVSTYSHLSGFDVRVGDRVSSGQTVARSGSTGNVTGPHLHFEIRRGRGYVDPRGLLNGEAAAEGASDGLAPLSPRSPRVSDAEALTYPGQREAAADGAAVRPSQPEPLPGTQGLGIADANLGIRQTDSAPLARSAGPAPDFTARAVPEAVVDRFRQADADALPEARDDGSAPTGRLAVEPVPGAPDFSARATPDRLPIDMSAYQDRIGQTVQSSGQNIGGLREAPRPGAVPRAAAQTFEGKSVSQLADDLRDALGLTQRQGRVSMKRAAGEYDTGSGVIRTRAVDELDVISHEAFHAFEYERKGPALAAVLKANARELKTLAYPGAPANVARQEGFAEFGRWYLTNPDHARRIAPQFYDAFEQALESDAPEVLARMKAIQSGYRNVLGSASIDVAKGSIAYTGRKGTLPDLVDEMRRRGVGSTVSRLLDDAYTAFVDDLHPLSVAVRKLSALYVQNTGQKLDLKRAADPYALARLSREAYAAGHSDLMHGVTPYQGIDPEGVSLADALETAGLATTKLGSLKPDATREFDAYLISRRMVHEWDRYSRGELPNPPDRNTRDFHAQVIADANAAHPTWEAAAQQAYEFQNNLWRKEFEAGLITKEAYDNGLAKPDYAPLMRDISDKGPGGSGKPRGGGLQFAGGVRAFQGSSRDIISPLSSIIRRSYELNAIIKRNDTLKALDDLAQAAGRGGGAIVERLPAKQIEAVTVQAADALQKTADELGLSGRDLTTVQKLADDATDQDATITLFKQSEFSPRKGEAVVFVWRDGKKTPLLLADGEFGQQMFQALAGMNRDLRNVVVDSMAAMTQTLRYGVTLSPEFMAANIIRDQVATWINSDVGFVPVVDMVRGAVSVIRQDADAKRYANAGGMTGGANVAGTRKPFPKTDAEAEAQLQMLRKKGYNVRRLVKGPWRALAEATDLSETSTRLGVFKRGFDQAKARGLSDYEALIESGFTSRDYLDFGRHGSKMVSAARVVTFLNAQVQGMDKSLRVLTAGGNLKRVLMPLTKEARTPAEQRALAHAYKAWAKIAALGAFGLALRMLYADDPEYEEIGDQLRATHWIFKSGDQWVFIPKPFELATVSNILERAYEGSVLKDPTAGERLLSDFRNTIAPPHDIPALTIPFQIGANRDHLGRPIVPDHLRGTVDPELQFNAYTSDLGKLIGRTFNVSPAVVDHVITGYGGSLGRYVLQSSNLAAEAATGRPRTAAGPEDMFIARRFLRDISRGSTSQAEFWDQVSRDGGEMVRAEGSFRSLMRDGKDAEAAGYLNRLPPAERAFVVAKVFAPEGQSVVHPLVRVQKSVSVLSDLRSDVREAELRDGRGAVIPLTPEQRRDIDGALADFALAEMRNALIATGVRGWEQKERMDARAIAERIRGISPAAYEQVWTRLAVEKAPTAIWPEATNQLDAMWGQWRPMMSAQFDPAQIVPMVRDERARNGDRGSRYQEAQRVAGGVYRPMTQPSPPAPSPRRGMMTQ